MEHDVWLLPLPYCDSFAWAWLIPAITAAVSAISSVVSNRINKKNQKELIDYTNQKNVENWNKQNDYNRSAIQRSVEDARSAGFSPTSFLSSSSMYNAGSVAGLSAPSASPLDLSKSVDSAMSAVSKGLEERQVSSQESLNTAQANYYDSLTAGNDLNNSFLGDILPLKTKLTQDEYNNAITLQGFYTSNPDLLKSIAEKQKVLNDNVNSVTSSNAKQLEVMQSVIDKNRSDISVNEKEIISSYIRDNFTLAQIDEIRDSNLRSNYSNVGYLVGKMNAVTNSDLSSEEKAEKLALLRDLYDNASGNSRIRLQYEYDKNLQDSKISAQSEQVDKYLRMQDKKLDWEKTQFGVNKVFEVIDKVGDAVIPFYEQRRNEDFKREMQHNEFEHDIELHNSREENKFVRDKRKYAHDKEMQESQHEHDKWMYDRKHSDNMKEYDSEIGWYDEEGYYHKTKGRYRKY